MKHEIIEVTVDKILIHLIQVSFISFRLVYSQLQLPVNQRTERIEIEKFYAVDVISIAQHYSAVLIKKLNVKD